MVSSLSFGFPVEHTVLPHVMQACSMDFHLLSWNHEASGQGLAVYRSKDTINIYSICFPSCIYKNKYTQNELTYQ